MHGGEGVCGSVVECCRGALHGSRRVGRRAVQQYFQLPGDGDETGLRVIVQRNGSSHEALHPRCPIRAQECRQVAVQPSDIGPRKHPGRGESQHERRLEEPGVSVGRRATTQRGGDLVSTGRPQELASRRLVRDEESLGARRLQGAGPRIALEPDRWVGVGSPGCELHDNAHEDRMTSTPGRGGEVDAAWVVYAGHEDSCRIDAQLCATGVVPRGRLAGHRHGFTGMHPHHEIRSGTGSMCDAGATR